MGILAPAPMDCAVCKFLKSEIALRKVLHRKAIQAVSDAFENGTDEQFATAQRIECHAWLELARSEREMARHLEGHRNAATFTARA